MIDLENLSYELANLEAELQIHTEQLRRIDAEIKSLRLQKKGLQKRILSCKTKISYRQGVCEVDRKKISHDSLVIRREKDRLRKKRRRVNQRLTKIEDGTYRGPGRPRKITDARS